MSPNMMLAHYPGPAISTGAFFSFSCIFRSATVLAFLAHHGHVVIYAPEGICCVAALLQTELFWRNGAIRNSHLAKMTTVYAQSIPHAVGGVAFHRLAVVVRVKEVGQRFGNHPFGAALFFGSGHTYVGNAHINKPAFFQPVFSASADGIK